MDEFEELEAELFNEPGYDSKSVAGDLGSILDDSNKTETLEQFPVGKYSVTLLDNYSDWNVDNPIRNQSGVNHLKEHLDEVIEGEIQIDFEKRNIEIDDKEVVPASKAWLLTPFVGFGLIFSSVVLGGVGFILGSFVCFCGFIPFMSVLLGTIFDPNNEHEANINREIERGGGVYRRGNISGVIHGLDTYFQLSVEHDDVSVTDAWGISSKQKLDVFAEVETYGSGDDSWTTGQFSPRFTTKGENATIELKKRMKINYGYGTSINKACREAIEYGVEQRQNWQGPIILHSLPVLHQIEHKNWFLSGKKDKKLQNICSKISAENKKRLKEVYDEVKFL
tara:strand:+ start:142 stop:1152 length:1011 start_codon:yes stop_codon:yes gene_type:complete